MAAGPGLHANGVVANGGGTKEKGRKLTKNEKRRLKKKAEREKGKEEGQGANGDSADGATEPGHANGVTDSGSAAEEDAAALAGVSVEYVSANVLDEAKLEENTLEEFKKIFDKFSTAEELTAGKDEKDTAEGGEGAGEGKDGADVNGKGSKEGGKEGGEEDEEGDADGPPKLSKKQRRLRSRMSVAQLKQMVARPEGVEAHDVTSSDPRLLVHLKTLRNTVAVPRHWCNKRKYLQGKRGIEKKPFELPDFILQTGIAKIRDALDEDQDKKTARQKSRDRMSAKTGKVDIDYRVLHDAFFKYQEKPKLSKLGDLYYEGKEFEVDMSEKTPGLLSKELREALDMGETSPPQWLLHMQRYGPPPAYPYLKIPGLNAPLPPGAKYGFGPGEWGKPPVDEFGNPLYGDVFAQNAAHVDDADVDKTLWGTMEEEVEEEESEDEAEEEEKEEGGEEGTEGAVTPAPSDGATSVASSAMTGLTTPGDMLDLRKRSSAAGLETPETPQGPKELYQVLDQQKAGVGTGLFGVDRTYKIGGGAKDVSVALNPDDLEDELKDQDALKERYEKGLQASLPQREDVSDIIAEETRKRKRKLDKAGAAKKKKDKDFQF